MAVASVRSAQSTRRFHAAAAVTSRLLRPEGSAALHASLWSVRGVPEARTCNEEARRRKEEPARRATALGWAHASASICAIASKSAAAGLRVELNTRGRIAGATRATRKQQHRRLQIAKPSYCNCSFRSLGRLACRAGPNTHNPWRPARPLRLQHPRIHCYEYRKAACKPACKPVDGVAGGGSSSALAAASSRQPGLGQMLQ